MLQHNGRARGREGARTCDLMVQELMKDEDAQLHEVEVQSSA